MGASESFATLASIPLGGRLLVRSRTDWRTAVVSRISDESVTLSIASPKGRNYRLRRDPRMEVGYANGLHFLCTETSDSWIDNFAVYDSRW